jgi:hypothetical protein
MAHAVRQVLPNAPPVYDQAYIAQLADAVNRYMIEREAGELVSPRYIMADPPSVGGAGELPPATLPSTEGLATGLLYLRKIPGTEADPAIPRFLTVVTPEDPL